VKFTPLPLSGVVLVEPRVYRDDRGFFLETYRRDRYAEGGIPDLFVQDNHSRSVGPVLRGLHGQRSTPQGKLVRCIEGEIFDVAVDVRRSSPSFGRWVGEVLSAQNHRQLFMPAGFLHGFCVLHGPAQVEYKCTAFYDPGEEIGVVWNDTDLNIRWPVTDPLLSARDRALPTLREITGILPA
jgi:dTDP-4-dehydrorhamnose 3,5-epimerase